MLLYRRDLRKEQNMADKGLVLSFVFSKKTEWLQLLLQGTKSTLLPYIKDFKLFPEATFIFLSISTPLESIANIIHLLPSLEGDMKICPTPKIHVARGIHDFSGWDKSSCLPTNWAINCLLYRKLKHDVIQRRTLCRETRQGNTTSGGKHDDLFSLHVTPLDQSYFFIRQINYMRYNNID